MDQMEEMIRQRKDSIDMVARLMQDINSIAEDLH